jgi:aspartyl-tRNA(Asn)/glutamyl-tRNA(Gln) amidotransferase subunit A
MPEGSTERFPPLRDLAQKLRARQVSPVELTEESLDGLARFGPKLNAVVTLMRESALAEAKRAESEIKAGKVRGLLHGIPYGVKDLLAAKGVPTTWGAEPFKNQVFDYDATVVERLRAAGAILVAKLAMVELAGGMGYNEADASFTGPGLNPWNSGFWSGGSSSGPGAAVGAGLVPFAIGSETSGSILTPSSYCGVTGLRPTYGMISRHGAMALCWTLDKLGPMARSADDCGIVLAAVAGADPNDESASKRGFTYRGRGLPTAKARLAVPKGCVEKVQPAVRENFEHALEALEPHATITRDVEWPDQPWGAAVSAIVNAEGAAAFRDLLESGQVKQLRCPADRTGGFSALLYPAVDYIHAMRLRRPMKRAVAKLFTQFDAVVSPSRGTVAYPANKKFEEAYPGISSGPGLIPAGNLCGLPALSMPSGYGENGLPTGIALMGPAFSEDLLLKLGNAYQDATTWHGRKPPLA